MHPDVNYWASPVFVELYKQVRRMQAVGQLRTSEGHIPSDEELRAMQARGELASDEELARLYP